MDGCLGRREHCGWQAVFVEEVGPAAVGGVGVADLGWGGDFVGPGDDIVSVDLCVGPVPDSVFASAGEALKFVAVGGGQAFADLVVADDDVAAFGSVETVHGAVSQHIGFAFSNELLHQ